MSDKTTYPILEATHPAGYVLSSDPAKLDVTAIHSFLARCYWSAGIPCETVARAVAGSLCFGLYGPAGSQVGFPRFVTDQATFAYLCDVYILEGHRSRGLGQWMIERALTHADLLKLRRLVLVTRDAHWLYFANGFQPLAHPECYMELHRPNIYADSFSDDRASRETSSIGTET